MTKRKNARAWEDRIGHKFVDRLPETVVQVGKDSFTRRDLVLEADSANFQAAANLDTALQTYHPKSVREVAGRVDQFMLRERDNIGDTAIMVWCRILDSKGVKVEKWLDQDFTEKNRRLAKRRRNRRKR